MYSLRVFVFAFLTPYCGNDQYNDVYCYMHACHYRPEYYYTHSYYPVNNEICPFRNACRRSRC